MKKIICSAVVAALCVWLAACGTQTVNSVESPSAVTTMASEEQPERVFVLSMENQDTDAFMTGVMNAFTDSNAVLEAVVCATESNCKAKLLEVCEEGYDYVVGMGSEIVDIITEVASDYPDTEFAIYDAEVLSSNVTGFYVDHKDAYFEAGVVAANVTKQSEISGINEEITIGWVGGMNLPIVKIYFTAFEEGAKSVEPEIQILEQYAGSWDDPEKGKKLTEELFALGADVVVNVADETGRGVLEAADELGIYVINMSGNMESSKSVVVSMEDDMEQIGYHMLKKMLDKNEKKTSSVELTMEDGCVVLDKESKAY